MFTKWFFVIKEKQLFIEYTLTCATDQILVKPIKFT